MHRTPHTCDRVVDLTAGSGVGTLGSHLLPASRAGADAHTGIVRSRARPGPSEPTLADGHSGIVVTGGHVPCHLTGQVDAVSGVIYAAREAA
jgi:hypothetical protein